MIYIPKISPVRIKQIVSGSFLSQDSGHNFYGIDKINFCNEIPLNKQFIFQIFSDTQNPNIYIDGYVLAVNDITPVNWAGLGSYVYEISFTPTRLDSFVINIEESGNYFESDSIIPVFDTSHLIKIEYTNSQNDFLYVGSTVLTAYFDAEYHSVRPENELTVYENDRGEMTKLRATPTENYELAFYNVPYYVINLINMIFSMDTILINGQPFQSNETVNVEDIEMSDIFNGSMLIQRTNDNYQNFTITDDGIVLNSDDNDVIYSDDNNKINF